jgi:putative endonuclease
MCVKRQYWVYIMTNRWNTVFYIGVTNNIARSVEQHKSGKGGIFTRKYNIGKLVYIELTDDIHSALRRDKQLKACSREKKNALITSVNPEWRDLTDRGF